MRTDANAAFNDSSSHDESVGSGRRARPGSILAAFQGFATGDFSGVPGKGAHCFFSSWQESSGSQIMVAWCIALARSSTRH